MAEANKPPIKVNNLENVELELTSKSVLELTKNLNNHPHILGSTNSNSNKSNRVMPLQSTQITKSASNTTYASLQRKCDNPTCPAPALISSVKRNASVKMIRKPIVVPKPILVKDNISVFEVGGQAVRAHEIENPLDERLDEDVIYRIVPNTHAHIMNYIIVDEAGDTLHKIKEKDPETMKSLAASQRDSAVHLLSQLLQPAPQQLLSVISPTSVADSGNATSRKRSSREKGPVKSANGSSCLGAALNVLKQDPSANAISKRLALNTSHRVLKRVAPCAAENTTVVVSPSLKSKEAKLSTAVSLSSAAASSSTSPSSSQRIARTLSAAENITVMARMTAEIGEIRENFKHLTKRDGQQNKNRRTK